MSGVTPSHAKPPFVSSAGAGSGTAGPVTTGDSAVDAFLLKLVSGLSGFAPPTAADALTMAIEEAKRGMVHAPKLTLDQTASIIVGIARDGLRSGASALRSATSLGGALGKEGYFCYNLINRTVSPVAPDTASDTAIMRAGKILKSLFAEQRAKALDTTKEPITRKREVAQIAAAACWQDGAGAFPVLAERAHVLSWNGKLPTLHARLADRWAQSMLVLFDGEVTKTFTEEKCCIKFPLKDAGNLHEVRIDTSLSIPPKTFRAIFVPVCHYGAVAKAFPGVTVIAVESVPVTRIIDTNLLNLDPAAPEKLRIVSFVPDYEEALQTYLKSADCPKLVGLHAVRFTSDDDLENGKTMQFVLPLTDAQKDLIRAVAKAPYTIEELEGGKCRLSISSLDLERKTSPGKAAKFLKEHLNIESIAVQLTTKELKRLQALQAIPEICTVVLNTGSDVPNLYVIHFPSEHRKTITDILNIKR